MEISRAVFDLFTSDAFSSKVLMTWWAIIDRYFSLGLHRSFSSREIEEKDRAAMRGAPIMELLAPETCGKYGLCTSSGKKHNFFIHAKNNAFVQAVRENEFADDAKSRRLRKAYETVARYAFHAQYHEDLKQIDASAHRFFQKLNSIIGDQLPFAVTHRPGEEYKMV